MRQVAAEPISHVFRLFLKAWPPTPLGMKNLHHMSNLLQTALIVAAVYVLCHGITAWVVTPFQAATLGEVTAFASLLYLPHGVRVLATWMYGWKAVPILALAAGLCEFLFTPMATSEILTPIMLCSFAVGATSAYLAFEAFRLLGIDLYAGRQQTMAWKWLLLIGAVASVLNSVGQTIVFSGLIFPGDFWIVLLIYALGDLIGLAVSMVLLMLIFRYMRLMAVRS